MNFRELQKHKMTSYMKSGAEDMQTLSESCNSALEIV